MGFCEGLGGKMQSFFLYWEQLWRAMFFVGMVEKGLSIGPLDF
jgi:hypothetical protein